MSEAAGSISLSKGPLSIKGVGAGVALLLSLLLLPKYVPVVGMVLHALWKSFTGQTPLGLKAISRWTYVGYGCLLIAVLLAEGLMIRLLFFGLKYTNPYIDHAFRQSWQAMQQLCRHQWFDTIFTFPVLEEIIFRGFLYKAVAKTFSCPVSMFMTSALFALAHDPIAMPGAFLFGLLASHCFSRTQCLALCILLHMGCNLVAVADAYLPFSP